MPSLALMAVMVAFFYFGVIRPQKKQAAKQQEMRDAVKIGDQIVTIGGLRGRVTKITDDSYQIETGDDHIQIEFVKKGLSYVVKPASGYEEMKEVNTPESTESSDGSEDSE